MSDWSRRKFIATTGAAALAGCKTAETAQTPATGTDVGSTDTGTTGAADTAAPTDAGTDTPPPTPDTGPDVADAGPPIPPDAILLGVARGDVDVEAAVRKAIALAGGLDFVKGKTVFIKPNCVYPSLEGFPGVATSPAVLAAVVKVTKEAGAKHITVGDRAARWFTSADAFDGTGQGAAALAAGADAIFPAPRPKEKPEEWLTLKPAHYEETWKDDVKKVDGVLAMKRLVEAEVVINVPVCKNHRWAVFSLAMKNYIGGVGDESRDVMHYQKDFGKMLSRDIAILNQMFHTEFCVLDAWTALVQGGPEGVGDDRALTEPHLIVACKDRLAFDAFGVSLLKRELGRATIAKKDPLFDTLNDTMPWKMPQILDGIALGIGTPGPEKVHILWDGVPEDDRKALETVFRKV